MFTFVPHAAFARWSGTAPGKRGADYERYKEAIGDWMIAAAEDIFPSIRRAIRFRLVGSPLTNEFYYETLSAPRVARPRRPLSSGPSRP